ncbi:MAG: monooxygenase [Puniceicoccaceae bacterium]|nr:MAG: monooxygenase [Puniceicoccaceae bacterium]
MERSDIEVLIIGAGPAGLGCALALKKAGIENFRILERSMVGASFEAWPREMRMITPSFHGNPFIQTDLNAVNPATSPADLFGREHPSGAQYAAYLRAVVQHYQLEVSEGVSVKQIKPQGRRFTVSTSSGEIDAGAVIWAAGEFGLPRTAVFAGAALCWHNSTIQSWAKWPGQASIVIGGYESGIDAAYHLVQAGKRVQVISKGEPWLADSADPSEALSPYTKERLVHILQAYPGQLELIGQSEVIKVARCADTFKVTLADGRTLETGSPPILATGFRSALTPVRDLFEWSGEHPVFTEEDASTLHPGLFYSGPSLVQRGSKFCFIYKFRARFGVVARAVADHLGQSVHPDLDAYAARGFMIDDLDCCVDCQCALDEADTETIEDLEVVQ